MHSDRHEGGQPDQEVPAWDPEEYRRVMLATVRRVGRHGLGPTAWGAGGSGIVPSRSGSGVEGPALAG